MTIDEESKFRADQFSKMIDRLKNMNFVHDCKISRVAKHFDYFTLCLTPDAEFINDMGSISVSEHIEDFFEDNDNFSSIGGILIPEEQYDSKGRLINFDLDQDTGELINATDFYKFEVSFVSKEERQLYPLHLDKFEGIFKPIFDEAELFPNMPICDGWTSRCDEKVIYKCFVPVNSSQMRDAFIDGMLSTARKFLTPYKGMEICKYYEGGGYLTFHFFVDFDEMPAHTGYNFGNRGIFV